jgi:hypothetical protein
MTKNIRWIGPLIVSEKRKANALLVAYGPWRVLFVSLKYVFEFLGHRQRDIGIETAQPPAPRAPKLK